MMSLRKGKCDAPELQPPTAMDGSKQEITAVPQERNFKDLIKDFFVLTFLKIIYPEAHPLIPSTSEGKIIHSSAMTCFVQSYV